MAKVKTEQVIIRDDSRFSDHGVLLNFKFDINVSTNGTFTCTLPHDIVDKFEQALIELSTNGRTGGKKGFFSAPTMDKLIEKVKFKCEEYTSRELIEEKLIIRYVIETACSYVKDEDGNFFPNGGFTSPELRDRQGNNGWTDGTLNTNAASPEPFGVRLWTQVVVKRTYSYKSGQKKIEFEPLWTPSRQSVEMNENIHWLANIVSIRPPKGSIMEIECTEETADFFINIYKVIFKMNEGIKQFAVDSFMITQFIESKQKLIM